MKNIILFMLLFSFTITLSAQIFDVDTISKTGDLDDRINLVFLSDGYQQYELDKFIEDVEWMLDAIFKKAPYSKYRDYFNAFAIKVPSAVSGAAEDPDSLINNYFGSTFNWGNIWRLVVPARSSKVQSVLQANLPQYDQVIMLVNESRYGGSGGWIATSTTHSNGPEICIHEMGHSFAGLADEYWAGSQYAREKINMTQETNPETVKWANWIQYNSVGIYAHSEAPSWYRPHQNCEMRYLGRQFCAVCQEAHASKILDLTSPIINYWPEEDGFINTDQNLEFKLNLIKPDPNTLQITWSLNADSIAANIDSIRVNATNLLPGTNTIRASILDTTKYIRKSSHSRVHKNTITWDFDAGTSGVHELKKEKFNLDIFPNPATDFISLRYELSKSGSISINLIGIDGKQLELLRQSRRLSGYYNEMFNLKKYNLASGTYYLEILLDDDRLSLPLIVQK